MPANEQTPKPRVRVPSDGNINTLIKGFIEQEIKDRQRKQGALGNQGAEASNVKNYLLSLGYNDETIDKLISAATGQQAEPSKEPSNTADLTPKQQKNFAAIQSAIKGGHFSMQQLKQFKRELSR